MHFSFSLILWGKVSVQLWVQKQLRIQLQLLGNPFRKSHWGTRLNNLVTAILYLAGHISLGICGPISTVRILCQQALLFSHPSLFFLSLFPLSRQRAYSQAKWDRTTTFWIAYIYMSWHSSIKYLLQKLILNFLKTPKNPKILSSK